MVCCVCVFASSLASVLCFIVVVGFSFATDEVQLAVCLFVGSDLENLYLVDYLLHVKILAARFGF